MEAQIGHLKQIHGQARPKTSAPTIGRKEDIFGLDETTQDEFDKELNEMIIKNQQRLAELQSDIKEVNKIAGEPVVNIRKIKQVRSIKGPIPPGKSLNIKPTANRMAMSDEVIDEA